MNFTERTYKKARNLLIDELLAFYRLGKVRPGKRIDRDFQETFDLVVKIVIRGQREKGLWLNE